MRDRLADCLSGEKEDVIHLRETSHWNGRQCLADLLIDNYSRKLKSPIDVLRCWDDYLFLGLVGFAKIRRNLR